MLKKIREERCLSQSELAKASGVNVRMIQYYEQGVKDIGRASVSTVIALAEALGVSTGEIRKIIK